MTRRLDLTPLFAFGVVALASLAAGRLIANAPSLRLAMLVISIPLVIGLGFKAPRALLFGLVCWLTALGFVRRLVEMAVGSSKADVLLLIGPVAVGVLLLVAAQQGAFKQRTSLANWVLFFNVLTLVSVLNPLQGSLLGGVAGLLFTLVPMLTFWVGRTFADDRTMGTVLGLISLLAIVTAIYGLGQTALGFPSWDQNWIDNSGYTSLSVSGTIRPFSTFSSAAEYAGFTAIALLVWLARSGNSRRVLAAWPVIALLGIALVYESSRSAILLLAAGLGVMLAARQRLPLAPALLAGAIVVGVLIFGVRAFAPAPSSALLAHQVQGISDPLNSSGTGPGHISEVVRGITSIWTRPLGSGIGSVTLAGARFGGVSQGTEAGISNAAVALGLPGLVAYLAFLWYGIRLAYRTAEAHRDWISYTVLGLLVMTSLNLLGGGAYAVSAIPWLALGWLDGRSRRTDSPNLTASTR